MASLYRESSGNVRVFIRLIFYLSDFVLSDTFEGNIYKPFLGLLTLTKLIQALQNKHHNTGSQCKLEQILVRY